MHLLLIRHGESENNRLEAVYGATVTFEELRSVDPELSARGQTQAQLLGRHLGAQLLGAQGRVSLMCSSMTRALQTSRPLARVLRLRPAVVPELLEVRGFYDSTGKEVHGMSRSQINQRFPECDASLIPEEGQGSETFAEAHARAATLAAVLKERASNDGPANEGVLVIISHNDFIVLLAQQLLMPSAKRTASAQSYKDLFVSSYWPLNNTGVSHIVLGVQSNSCYAVDAWLTYWNRSDHLSERHRSGVQFKNLGFCRCAEWARLGEGGSGLPPRFAERRAVRELRSTWLLVVAAAAAGAAAAGAVLLLRA